MKKIFCLLSEKLPDERKQKMVDFLKDHASSLGLPFQIDLFVNQTIDQYKDYHYAIAFFPPANILKQFPSLEFVISLNAGVNDVIQELQSKIPLSRVIYQPALDRMKEHILYCILDYTLLMSRHRKNQELKIWDRSKPYSIANDNIGIMGLGRVGQGIAETLIKLGKKVQGFSKTTKSFVNKSFTINNFSEFLSTTNILINALPLNSETEGILNAQTMSLLPDQSCIINVGRGGHIIEDDLLKILKTDKLNKVYLDVFGNEPLPEEHPFWSHPKIFLTPHISGIFDVLDVLKPAIDQIKEFYENGRVINAPKY
ncbi:MAG TPA: NAD(P)-dependent oxidoreductase [Patescibacteria group bacterium]|nr:NAD(P)-dependent oxidoreductase [Gammaproteobacteria bacterium]HWA51539.1 NAD(P)-dependent oxidoreductase [Patescibacteria group bacterium]